MTEQRTLFDRIAAAFLWTAAFSFATGVFFSLTLLLRWLPPSEPVAVGLVTIERVSKLADYVGAALFFLLVPPLTIWFQRIGARLVEKNRFDLPATILFATPFFLSPILYLTTGKVGWILVLPAGLSWLLPRALQFVREHRWIRRIFLDEDLRPYHALVFAGGLSWLLFRYIVTVKRIAHYPTLFLEIVFVALFLSIFWGAALLIARLTEVLFGRPHRETFKRIAIGALPLVALPVAAMFWVPVTHPFAAVLVALLLSIFLATRRLRMEPASVRRLATLLVIPILIFVVSYASTAELSQWIDLFHRGESIGPASDYLRGKVPYRDVFPIHGMLEDGLLDSWLMRFFGRSLDVAVARSVVLGALLPVALWFLGLAVFNSIPLALLCVVMASWTTTENNRTLFQVVVVALFWFALERRSRVSALLAGVVAGFALFFSYDIGLYSITGAIVCAVALTVVRRRVEWTGLSPVRAILWFVGGTLLGASPFVIYLAWRGALDDFFVTSFVTLPSIIDAVWSLPFPDLVSTFRRNLNLNTLAEFVLLEKFHLILSPLTIVVAAVYFIQRYLRRRAEMLDHALLVLTIFAAITQRTAFGRAEFRHQYFAAFLIAPVLILLALAFVRRLKELWTGEDDGAKPFVTVVVAIAIPLAGVLFWVPDLVNVRISDLIGFHWRVLKLARDGAAEEVAYRIADVSAETRRLTGPNDPIFDFSNQPAFYFFADRPNPTRFYQVPILSPRAFQAETITALERSKTKVIVRTSPEGFDLFDGVSNDLRAQAVSAYIEDCYRFHRAIRGVELWRRVDRPCAAPVARYVDRIRLPARSELARGRRNRMVFPAVGSIPGIGGALWVSDLTLHNPFTGPIPVRLRYVAGETRVDRRVTLGPRQTIHWPDVVRSLFAAPQSVGALWIEHRAGQPPAATVKTHDSTRPSSRAAVEAALTARNAATANTENAELTILGLPGGTGRRINVGAVNTGIIPATFRITARSRTGQIIGRAVESGVGEDSIWLVPDIERELGVKLDESMTLRMTVIAGTGAGFATAITADGDQEFIAAIPTQQQR